MAGSVVIPHTREKPLMVFDGECHFCRRWITRWEQETGEAVDYAPSQEVGATFPEIPQAEFDREVKLIEPNGRVYGGAEAVFRVLCQGDPDRHGDIDPGISAGQPGERDLGLPADILDRCDDAAEHDR